MEDTSTRFGRLFHAMDLDRNGLIDRGDLRYLATAVARESGLAPDSPRVHEIDRALEDLWEAIAANVDMDGSGSVDEGEFVVFGELLVAEIEELGGKSPPAAFEVVDAMWAAMDTNGDGELSLAEWAAFLRAVNLGVDPEQTFAIVDGNRDGVIDVIELDALVVHWLRYGFERPISG